MLRLVVASNEVKRVLSIFPPSDTMILRHRTIGVQKEINPKQW